MVPKPYGRKGVKYKSGHAPTDAGIQPSVRSCSPRERYLEYPERPTSKALQAIFDDAVLTRRFHLRQKTVDDPPQKEAAAESAPPPP